MRVVIANSLLIFGVWAWHADLEGSITGRACSLEDSPAHHNVGQQGEEQRGGASSGDDKSLHLLQRKALSMQAMASSVGDLGQIEGEDEDSDFHGMTEGEEQLEEGYLIGNEGIYAEAEGRISLLEEGAEMGAYASWEAPYAAAAETYIMAFCGLFFTGVLTHVVLTSRPGAPRGLKPLQGKAGAALLARQRLLQGHDLTFCVAAVAVASGTAFVVGRWASMQATTLKPRTSMWLCGLWFLPVMIHWVSGRLHSPAWKVSCKVAAESAVEQRLSPKAKSHASSVSGEDALLAKANAAKAAAAGRADVLLASLEHSLPHKDVQMVSGGLGKVIGFISRKHPTPITMVHPVMAGVEYSLDQDDKQEDIVVEVDGEPQQVEVFQSVTVIEPYEGTHVCITFLLLRHAWFLDRPWNGMYPSTMTGRQELLFFSLWNQCVAALLVRHKATIFHCPDYHAAMAPLYALPQCPGLRMLLVLHNASYQGAAKTDMVEGERLARLAEVFNLAPGILQQYCLHDGRFNMLKAGSEVVRRQQGRGICAVSTAYAKEAQHEHSFLRGFAIAGLDNPMEDLPLVREVVKDPSDAQRKRAEAKAEVQKMFGLQEDSDAKLLVFLGRMVKQKGMDLLVELLPWIMDTFTQAQLVFLGPVGDAHGLYTKSKLEMIVNSGKYKGRIYVCCKYVDVPSSLYYAADFCLVPSRDEPFGYVDIEFAWRGALCIGAAVGGLGKVPGFYYKVDDKENDYQQKEGLQAAVRLAMQSPLSDLEDLRQQAYGVGFPIHRWQAKIQQQIAALLCSSYTLPFALERARVQRRLTEIVAFFGHRPKQEKEVFTPELSMDEVSAGVEEALSKDPDASFKEVLGKIGLAHDLALEHTSEAQGMLRPVPFFGMRMRWIHFFISLAYITSPVVDMAVVMFVQQWIALSTPEQSFEAKLMMAELRAASFIVHSLGCAVGSGVWSYLCKLVPPRTLMIGALCIEPPLLLLMYIAAASELSLHSDGRTFLLTALFMHGAASASAILFVVFNYMMTLTELRDITIITSTLDSGRVFVTLMMSCYVFSVSTDSFQNSTLVVAPLVLLVAARALLTWPLLYAPRAYREERMPHIGVSTTSLLQTVWQYKAYVSLVLVECCGQIAAFPSLLCVVWFSLGGWSTEEYTLGFLLGAVVVAPAVLLWGCLQWTTATHVYNFITGAALYIPPVSPLLALVLQQASDGRIGPQRGMWAMLLCIVVFTLKSVRSSSLGVLRVQLVKTQWHYVAVRLLEACCTNFCRAISPFICSMVLHYMVTMEQSMRKSSSHVQMHLHMWSFESDSQLELANAITVTTLPLAAVEILSQLWASRCVNEELSLPTPPAGHPRSQPPGYGRHFIAALTTAGLFWAAMGASHAKIVGPLSLISV